MTRGDWKRWLPGFGVLQGYQAAWLRHDILAGLVLTTILAPAGVAYAQASGIPPVYGLYATIGALLAYAVVGPSRILVLGPDSALAALIAAVVLPLAAGNGERAAALGSSMALVVGILCAVAGLGRLGFITELLSKPIRYGYMNGIALTVLVGQLPKLFGFSAGGGGFLTELQGFVQGLTAGAMNLVALAIGLGTLCIILALKRWRQFPGILLAVAAAAAVVAVFDLGARAGVSVLGPLPQGLPRPALPAITWADLPPVLLGSVAVALVAFADTSVLSRTYAAKIRTAVNPSQELVALGTTNLVAGLFQGFPVSSSSSRTPVAEAAGARTQLTGVVGALAIGVLLVAAPNLLQALPEAALAAVVIASAIGLFVVRDLQRIYRIQRWEFWLSMLCFAGVALLGAVPGIGIAVVLAVIEFLWDGWRPHSAVLGRVDGVKGYHDITRYPQARLIPGLVLFRWDAPLFFANAELFAEQVLVAAEPVTSVDVTAADMLTELDNTLRGLGIELAFAEMKDPVKDKLKRFGLFAHWGDGLFFATIGEAVGSYVDAYDVDWLDWSERAGREPR
jgi:high affinity sulfate transporter 1